MFLITLSKVIRITLGTILEHTKSIRSDAT